MAHRRVGRDCSAEGSNLNEELAIFHELEKETLQVDRSVLQQSETIKRLQKMKDKLEAKKEKEKIKLAHWDAQLKSALHANKSIKENLKGKRQARKNVEETVHHLERQLQLEKIDSSNKLKGFEQTRHKYDGIWKNYESVYSSMPHVAEKVKAEDDLKAANAVTSKLKEERDAIQSKIAAATKTRDLLWNKSALLIAKHLESQKLVKELALLKEKKSQVTGEIEKLNQELNNAQINNSSEETLMVKRQSKIRDIMNSLAERSEDLQNLNFLHILSVQPPNDETAVCEQDFDIAPFEFEDSSIADFAASRNEGVVLPQNNAMVVELESSILSETYEGLHKTSSLGGSKCDGMLSIIPADTTEPSSNVLEGSAQTEDDCPENNGSNFVEKVSEMPVNPPLNSNHAEGPVEEFGSQNAPDSQISLTPNVVQSNQEQVLISTVQENVPVPPVPAWDQEVGSDQDGMISPHGTESTTGSIANLLDDEKRQEFMRKLMATPTMSIPLRETENEDNSSNVQSSPKSGVTDNSYLQKFYTMLTDGNNGMVSNPGEAERTMQTAPATAHAQQTLTLAKSSSEKHTSNPINNVADENFLCPPPPATNATGFGAFGGFFGGDTMPSSGGSMFGNAFDNQSGNAANPENSAFSFNFGGTPSNTTTSSFMNLF